MFFLPMQHKAAGLSHNPLKAIVSPRPIAWVSSRGADGSINLAPYSFFNAVSEDPAMLFFSAAVLAGGQRKDSLRNIEETGEFTVNVVGSVSIGILTAIAMNYTLSQETMLFLSTGLLGAFTTMSTFSFETVCLLKEENYIIALTYATLSFCLCIIGAFAGYSLGSKLNLG